MACTRFTMDSVLDSTQKQEKSVIKIDILSALNGGGAVPKNY